MRRLHLLNLSIVEAIAKNGCPKAMAAMISELMAASAVMAAQEAVTLSPVMSL